MAPKTYTLTEVSDLLTVDPKSLRRWIEIEKFDLSAQTTPYDKRVKFLTLEQVEKLAKAHDRQWPPKPKAERDQAQASQQGLPGAVNMLRERVTELEMATERIPDLERKYLDLGQKYTQTLLDYSEMLLKAKEQSDHINTLEQKYAELLETVKDLQQPKKPSRKRKAEGADQGEEEAPAADNPGAFTRP